MTKIHSKIINSRQILTIEYQDGTIDTFAPLTLNYSPEIILEAQRLNIDLTQPIPEGIWELSNL
jgi:hypothetical protein